MKELKWEYNIYICTECDTTNVSRDWVCDKCWSTDNVKSANVKLLEIEED